MGARPPRPSFFERRRIHREIRQASRPDRPHRHLERPHPLARWRLAREVRRQRRALRPPLRMMLFAGRRRGHVEHGPRIPLFRSAQDRLMAIGAVVLIAGTIGAFVMFSGKSQGKPSGPITFSSPSFDIPTGSPITTPPPPSPKNSPSTNPTTPSPVQTTTTRVTHTTNPPPTTPPPTTTTPPPSPSFSPSPTTPTSPPPTT